MSSQTRTALENVDLLALLAECDYEVGSIGLRDLERVGLAGRVGTRWYARSCSGQRVGRCAIEGCERHDYQRSVHAREARGEEVS